MTVKASFENLVDILIASATSGAFTFGAAVTGYRGPSALTDGATYSYSIIQGANWEVGQGIYTASGTTMTRIVTTSSNSGSPISLSAGASLQVVLLKEDIVRLRNLVDATTDLLTEGTVNKWYTDARARAAISAGSGIQYNSSTGVISQPSQPVHLVIEGDSKAQLIGNYNARSALFWALARFPRDLYYDPTVDNLALGSSVSGNDPGDPIHGMTSSVRLALMVTRLTAVVALGHRPAVVIKIGANDYGLPADNVSGSIIANIEKAWNTYKAAGAIYCILFSVDPRGSLTATEAAMLLATNRAMREYARQHREVFFVDNQVGLADQSSTVYQAVGGNARIQGCSMYDNPALHESAYGAWLQSQPFYEVLRLICPPRSTPNANVPADIYNNPSSPSDPAANAAIRGNLLGKQGRFYDTGGTASNVLLTGGGGVTGTTNFPSSKLFANNPSISGTMSGTMACAISQVPYQPMVDEFGRSDIMATRLTFSGTPTSDGLLLINATVLKPTNFDYTQPLQCDADMFLTALSGFNISLTPTVGVGYEIGGPATPASPADCLLPISGRLTPYFCWDLVAPSVGSNMQVALKLSWFNGYATTGTIDLFGMSLISNYALAAPTP